MSKNEYDHHQPRQLNKGKKHSRGFSEDVQENRQNRVSFKNYLRQVKEEELENDDFEDDLTEARPMSDEDRQFLISDFKEWSGGLSPEEVEDGQLQAYAYESAPTELDSYEVLSFLRSYTGE